MSSPLLGGYNVHVAGSRARVAAATTPTAIPPAPHGSDLSPTALKYRLADRFGRIFFCDRDRFPVARQVSDDEVARRVAILRQNTDQYDAILEHLGLRGVTTSVEQNRAIDGERKRLDAIQLEPGSDGYAFRLRTGVEGESGASIQGTVNGDGSITVLEQNPTVNRCPVCLDGSSLIDTPAGMVRVRDLQRGMPIWTETSAGARQSAVVLETVARPVARGVGMIHLVIQNGQELIVSAGHPTADGRLVGDLVAGDTLDGLLVESVRGCPLEDDATYDVLPSGDTGTYWANGIRLRSTLKIR